MITPLDVALYALIPAIFALIGSFLGSFFVPSKQLSSVIQHFVAGIVLAAVAVELLPKILPTKSVFDVGLGFIIGVIVMLAVEGFAHHIKHKDIRKKIPLSLIFAVAIDLFVDGLLIGVSFIAGKESGIWIAISLSSCAFFLTLSTATILSKKEVLYPIRMFCFILFAVVLPIGALIGATIISHIPSQFFIETLAFGVAALLYLAIEELIVAAHEDRKEEPVWVTATFFIGFLLILLLRM